MLRHPVCEKSAYEIFSGQSVISKVEVDNTSTARGFCMSSLTREYFNVLLPLTCVLDEGTFLNQCVMLSLFIFVHLYHHRLSLCQMSLDLEVEPNDGPVLVGLTVPDAGAKFKTTRFV